MKNNFSFLMWFLGAVMAIQAFLNLFVRIRKAVWG